MFCVGSFLHEILQGSGIWWRTAEGRGLSYSVSLYVAYSIPSNLDFPKLLAVAFKEGDISKFALLVHLPDLADIAYVCTAAGKHSRITYICCPGVGDIFATAQRSLFRRKNAVALSSQTEISTSSRSACQSALPSVLLHTGVPCL